MKKVLFLQTTACIIYVIYALPHDPRDRTWNMRQSMGRGQQMPGPLGMQHHRDDDGPWSSALRQAAYMAERGATPPMQRRESSWSSGMKDTAYMNQRMPSRDMDRRDGMWSTSGYMGQRMPGSNMDRREGWSNDMRDSGYMEQRGPQMQGNRDSKKPRDESWTGGIREPAHMVQKGREPHDMSVRYEEAVIEESKPTELPHKGHLFTWNANDPYFYQKKANPSSDRKATDKDKKNSTTPWRTDDDYLSETYSY